MEEGVGDVSGEVEEGVGDVSGEVEEVSGEGRRIQTCLDINIDITIIIQPLPLCDKGDCIG